MLVMLEEWMICFMMHGYLMKILITYVSSVTHMHEMFKDSVFTEIFLDGQQQV